MAIKIIVSEDSTKTTVNDIPKNTTFYGRLRREDFTWTERLLWFNLGRLANGPYCVSLEPRGGKFYPHNHSIFLNCVEVIEYEPVEVELTVVRK